MRRRRRQDTNTSERLPDRIPPEDRVAPPSALTSWLRQGLSSGICPLCRVAHKADREYIWQFYDERSNDGAVIDQVSSAFGFCAEHIEMLRRIDVEDMKSTLSISAMFAETFTGVVGQLRDLSADQELRPEACPACASRDTYLQKNATYLLDLIATGSGYREIFGTSPGLCFPHFKLVWQQARSAEERRLLLEVQVAAAESLLHELREHVRKQDHKFAHEAKGSEQDSWQRAIYLTSGWPPPAQTASRPEDG